MCSLFIIKTNTEVHTRISQENTQRPGACLQLSEITSTPQVFQDLLESGSGSRQQAFRGYVGPTILPLSASVL